MDRAYNDANTSVQNLMANVDQATPGAAEIAEALRQIQVSYQNTFTWA